MGVRLKIKRGISAARYIVRIAATNIKISKTLKPFRPLWLISERGIDARDNG